MSNADKPRFEVNKNLNPSLDLWEWQFEGACRDEDPETFFLEYNERGMSKRRKEVKAVSICKTCPVIQECLTHALKVPEIYGVWGGTTEDQRMAILRRVGVKYERV